jgi:diaminohydroxyphosphoribosylaminopyrimidine deaminase/5-amino-6-(5-phosphoribosylamino)uracil reductase
MSYEGEENKRVLISNEYTNRLVHKWRSEEASILVGTNTALLDDPALTVRLWKGPDPIRLVIDKDLRLPASLRLFDGQVKTVVFNLTRHEEQGNLQYYQLAEDSSLVHQLVTALYQLKIQSVLVEGGAALLQSFMDEGYWDEARVITNETLQLPDGLASPVLPGARLTLQERLLSDVINYYCPDSAAGVRPLQ